jgi:hypothetical protein
VGNNTSELVGSVEDNTVRTGRTTSVNAATLQDRELVVGLRHGEIEALVVVVDVGVIVGIIAGLVELVSSSLGGANGTAGVANGSAGGSTCASFDIQGRGEGAGQEEGGRGQDLNMSMGDVDDPSKRSWYLSVLHIVKRFRGID